MKTVHDIIVKPIITEDSMARTADKKYTFEVMSGATKPEIAKAVEAEGADSISMINTLLGMRIDIRTKRPILHNNVGGLSGPAIFPVAVRMVWQCYNAVKIPIIGMGGISTWEDAVEMMMAGATALQIGTVLFTDPYAPIKIADGMNEWLDKNGIKSVSEITGTVKPW